ncbi:DNA-binding protein [Oscillatoriales cyanobacterium USR001]|nr:DNA-binding protein [Oscillatoriales cyanobacterium USR001]
MTTTINLVWVKAFRIFPLWLILWAGLCSCENLPKSPLSFNFNITTIAEIQEKRQQSAQVYVKGKVEDRANFLGTAAYQLRDSTGKIWVVSKQIVPQSGEEILIKGLVRYKSIKIKQLPSQDLGEIYIEEIEQIKEAPQPKNNS